MKGFPRLRQACQGDLRESVAGARHGQPSRLAMNCVYLSGVLAADPQTDEGRDGSPVTLLLLAFPAPDTPGTVEGVEAASCEIEVPAAVAGRWAAHLRAGAPVFLTGQLTGGGGVMAAEIHVGGSLSGR